MKLRSLDLIIERHKKPTELISHSIALGRGWRFLGADISVDEFLERDCEIETPSAHVVAIEHPEGVNFYAKPL